MTTYVRRRLRRLVRRRAALLCEYCRLPESRCVSRLHLDHVVGEQHGGATTDANLAVACPPCNRNKGSNIATLDPRTGALVRLFHPRRDVWEEHFERHDGTIRGRTPVGRGTVRLLRMNDPDRVAERQTDVSA